MANVLDFPNGYSNLSQYAVLANSSIANNGASVITGNLGSSAGLNSSITGFPTPGTITGARDAFDFGNSARSALAGNELANLYSTAAAFTGTALGLAATLGPAYGPGTYTGASSIFVDGTVTLTGGPTDQFFFIANTTIIFGSVTPPTIVLAGGAKSYNVFWVSNSGITYYGGSTIRGILVGGSGGGNTYNGLGKTTIDGANYSVLTITLGNNDITLELPCYLKGTLILTESGYVPIENIKAGDKVQISAKINSITDVVRHEPKLQTCVGVSLFKVAQPTKENAPICFLRKSLDLQLPEADLYLSPNHGVLVENRLVLAKDLVNGDTIFQDFSHQDIEYYHIELDSHACVTANGILAESFA